MKKITRILVAAVLLMAMTVSSAFAATTTVTVDSIEAAPGAKQVEVAVTIDENNPGFASFGMNVAYDETALELVSIDTELAGYFEAANGIVAYAGSKDVVGKATLFTMTFNVKEAAAADAAVSVTVDEIASAKGVAFTPEVANGGITLPEEDTNDDPTVGPSEPGVNPPEPEEPVVEEEPAPEKSADTDDNFNIALFGALALAAVAAGGCTVFARRRG